MTEQSCFFDIRYTLMMDIGFMCTVLCVGGRRIFDKTDRNDV